ncbi:MAG: tetratricopeptide repeat protein [Myxococcota bacterium]
MRPPLRATARSLIIALALLSTSQVCLAQSEADEERARSLFQQGNALVEQARYADALEKFEAAYAAWQNPKIKLNLATTLRELGRYAESLEAYQQYLNAAEPSAEKRTEVERICSELQTRVARIRVRSERAVRRLSLDGRRLQASANDEFSVDAGHHTLLAESDGVPPQALDFDVVAGERRTLSLMFAPPSPTPPTAPAPVHDQPQRNPRAGVTDTGEGLLLSARVDMDGKARGALAAVGVGYAASAVLRVNAGGLLGAHSGVYAGVEASPFGGTLRPTFGVSLPMFFVDGLRPGISAELGLRQSLHTHFVVFARAALVHFPAAPQGYTSTLFVPSLGAEVRL